MARAGGKDRGIFEKVKGSGAWWIRYCDSTGQEHREKVGPKSLAKARYEQRKTEIRQEKFDPEEVARRRRKTLLTDAVLDHLAEVRVRKRTWREDERYGKLWTAFFAGKTLEEIRPADIERWRRERMAEEPAPKPATLNRPLAFLKTLFNRVIKNGLVEKNPVTHVKLLRENNRRVRFLTHEEEERLRDEMTPEDFELVEFAIHTGLRRGEQFGLRWENVDLVNEVLTIPQSKHGEKRHVQLNDRALEILRGLRSRLKSEWVFLSRRGAGPIDPHNLLNRVFYPALAEAGIGDFHWHDLRHNAESTVMLSRIARAGILRAWTRIPNCTTRHNQRLLRKAIRSSLGR